MSRFNPSVFAPLLLRSANVDDYPRLASETDDTGRINRAIADVRVNTLTFTHGKTYVISGKISGKSNLVLRGNGATIQWAANSNPTTGGDANMGMLDFTAGTYSNVVIEGLTVDGNYRNNPWVTQNTYTTASTNGVDGIRAGSISTVVIRGCTFYDMQKMGVDINGTGSDIWVYGNIVNLSQKDGLFVVGSNVHIFDNDLTGTGDNAIAFDAQFLGTPSSVSNVFIHDNQVNITNPVSYQSGIYVGGKAGSLPSNADIHHNTILGTSYHGILVTYFDTVKISGNTVKNLNTTQSVTPHGILVSNSNNVDIASANQCYNCKGSGIVINGNTSVRVMGNVCWNNLRDGIQVDGGNSYVTIKGNTSFNNGRGPGNVDENWSGIRLYALVNATASTNIEIRANRCFDNTSPTKIQRYGITCESGASTSPFNYGENWLDGNSTGLSGGNFPTGAFGSLESNYGSAVISSGTTSVTVNHGMSATPGAIQLTPGGNLGNVWYTNITATQFTINCSTAPAANTGVSWKAER